MGKQKLPVFKPFPYYEILSGKCKKMQQDRRCKLKNLKKREEESFNQTLQTSAFQRGPIQNGPRLAHAI